MDYVERTLLKLKRRYSKDETVAALIKENSELKIEIGILKNTIEEFESENNNLIDKKQIKKLTGEIRNLTNNLEVQKEIKRNRDTTIKYLKEKIEHLKHELKNVRDKN